MEKVVVDQLVARISALLHEKLGMRGASLEARVRRAGRALPRRVRRAAKELVNAESMAQEPKMLLRLDPQQVSAAYDTCLMYLENIDERALKTKALFGFAASVIVQVILIAAVALAVLRWRGYI
ncbi:hypothetical protein BCF46_0663 [Litoreibacter meonggei]|uniref:Uncharacterized protein n=1 Tax=Litoreibacter meonggei TaxID=1049199 RepID=A0A497X5H7_9RHOB|nr:hypothetical protein [Litoreibacter meonggei]RLJ60462.1 hypothetical protein BCF46_0663 [Litoreibacter meonggei]